MMIQNNNDKFRVRFSYSVRKGSKTLTGGKALANLKGKRVTTTATVSKMVGDNWQDLVTGTSVRNPLDPFRKSVGRRLALQNAFQNDKDINGNHVNLSKEVRSALRNEYFNLHADGTDLMIEDFETKEN